jgi:hypothetical protein
MKLQNILRTQVAVIGFAAAFLLAGGARAQEIDNTIWEDSPNVERFPQPAPAAAANVLSALPTVQADAAAVIAQPSVTSEAVVSSGTAREGWVIGMSIMFMAPLAVVLLAKLRRAKQSVNARATTAREAPLSINTH